MTRAALRSILGVTLVSACGRSGPIEATGGGRFEGRPTPSAPASPEPSSTPAIVEVLEACASSANLTFPVWTPLPDELLLLGLALRDESAPHVVSGNGLGWTLVAARDNDRGQMGVALYRASGPAPETGPVVVALAGNSAPAYAVAARLSGVATSGAGGGIESFATASSPSDADDPDLQVTITTLSPAARVIAWGGHRGSATLTPAPGESVILQSSADCGSSGDRMRGHLWWKPAATPGTFDIGGPDSLDAPHPWAAVAVSAAPGG